MAIEVGRTPQENARIKQKAERELRRRLLAVLGELGGAATHDEDVVYEGDRLVIPKTMNLKQAVQFLENKIEEDEELTTFTRTFRYRPWDGAWCTWVALRKVFGAVGHRSSTIQTFFGPRKAPPQMLTINTGVHEQEQVPWGDFRLPALPGLELVLGESHHPEFGPLFQITASGPKKYRFQVEGLFKVVQEELEERSMYRGKAFDGQEMPEFIDLTSVDPERVVYSGDVLSQMEANVWSQLRYTRATSQLGIPLKRAVLVFGPYGTGKSLFGILTAQEAVSAGWTFIMARPGRDNLMFVMQTARLYQPAVVFYEDMDRVASAEEEDDQMTQLLDVFDGINSKGTKLMAILTTNHPEKIHKAMVRPGRLDAIIKIADLDQDGVQKLIESNVPQEIIDEEGLDFTAIFEAMQLEVGDTTEIFLPSFVRETGDRAMRFALTRVGGVLKDVSLNTDDFVQAAHGLHPQLELMSDAKDSYEPEAVGAAHERVVRTGVREEVTELLTEAGFHIKANHD